MMATPDPERELKTPRAEQAKTGRDEVFGGLSPAERADYNQKSHRIHDLENEIHANSVATTNSESAKAEQRHPWNKQSETDATRGEGRQSYRSREEGSTNSSKQRAKIKRVPREKDDA
jgi:hypothetical protein